VADPGTPSSYLELREGTEVVSADGIAVGTVQHVLADEEEDIFDGLVIDTRPGPGGLRFADAPQVGRIYEHEVRLTIDAAEVERLPEPSANPAVMEAGPDDLEETGLAGKLRRAWDRISGNY
jgi:sporulation protein YlmC with PRC-barrel domain